MSDSPNFVDYVKIFMRSGKGGAGSMHFHRSRIIVKGGPDGGDGGRGGHVILRANNNVWTLLPLKYRKHIHAENGDNGSGNKCSGSQGQDTVLDVPLGTIIRDAETGDYIGEVTEHGQEIIVKEGGMGGKGNMNFATPTNQSPRYAQPGMEGIEGWVILELKVLADVGLVGFPNAGKSTLLSVLSAAKPKIANYAFTTITPNLGIVAYRNFQSFVMADIPGIIEGASEGKGLGHRFLRHIERNATLLYMIPADSKDYKEEFNILKEELRKYNPELMQKSACLAITKSDILDDELKEEIRKELPEGIDAVFISSVAQMGLDELKDMIWKHINKEV